MYLLRDQLHALEPCDSEDGGIYADKKGYHNTRAANQRRWPGDYSIRDAIDQTGPADKAAGIDWTFRSAQRGDYRTIAKYFGRFMRAAKAADRRLAGWREAYGQVDNDRAVEGWDCRYHRAITSDSSHLWHIHFSETRAYTTSKTNKEALLSVLKGETLSEYLARGGQLIGRASDPSALREDGILGPRTISRWQQIMGTSADGVISPVSDLVKAVQRHLNANGASPKLPVDGKGIRQDGKVYQTVRALQRYLGTTADGILTPGGSLAVRVLQRRLNTGSF